MLDTIILSEVHPYRLIERFDPFDPVQTLLLHNKFNNLRLIKTEFLNRIEKVLKLTDKEGYKIVLRDHTHSDYLIANDSKQTINKMSLINVLKSNYDTLSILTIRNPVDTYLSLTKNKWNTSNLSFENYCERFLQMCKTYEKINCKIIRYEDFCNNPNETMKLICKILKLDFNKDFLNSFYLVKTTGNSGRGRNYKKIKNLKKKHISKKFINEITNSKSFAIINKNYEYSI
jgi:hypothetical protein